MTSNEITKDQHQHANAVRVHEQVYVPAADVFETPEAIVIKFDMPGVAKEDLDIKLDRDMLSITGKVQKQPQSGIVYQEYRVGDYRRQFTISEDLDAENIKAEMNAGVLTLTIAKAPKAKPRKIEIVAA